MYTPTDVFVSMVKAFDPKLDVVHNSTADNAQRRWVVRQPVKEFLQLNYGEFDENQTPDGVYVLTTTRVEALFCPYADREDRRVVKALRECKAYFKRNFAQERHDARTQSVNKVLEEVNYRSRELYPLFKRSLEGYNLSTTGMHDPTTYQKQMNEKLGREWGLRHR